MKKEILIKDLETYQSKYPDEIEVSKRFIDFISKHDDCFHRTLTIGHITGSAWVVDLSGKNVLLTHHKKLNRWLQLGGHADGNSNILEVAIREVEEESGLDCITPLSKEIFDLDIHKIPKRGNEPEHDHFDVRYAIQHQGSGQYVVSDESHDLSWIEINNLSMITNEESMQRMARKWKAEQAELYQET